MLALVILCTSLSLSYVFIIRPTGAKVKQNIAQNFRLWAGKSLCKLSIDKCAEWWYNGKTAPAGQARSAKQKTPEDLWSLVRPLGTWQKAWSHYWRPYSLGEVPDLWRPRMGTLFNF
jgi:hypothetical protein